MEQKPVRKRVSNNKKQYSITSHTQRQQSAQCAHPTSVPTAYVIAHQAVMTSRALHTSGQPCIQHVHEAHWAHFGREPRSLAAVEPSTA